MLTQSETKYFTPSIEDIRVGYEMEGIKVLEEDIEYHILILRNKPELYKVPYLTKEQIEAEGWKEVFDNLFEKEEWKLFMDGDHKITIEKGWDTFFYGECKDINTFRYICKLLGI